MKPMVIFLLAISGAFLVSGSVQLAYAAEEDAAGGMSGGEKLLGAGLAFGSIFKS